MGTSSLRPTHQCLPESPSTNGSKFPTANTTRVCLNSGLPLECILGHHTSSTPKLFQNGQPRLDVELPRISHVFWPARIRSSHFFFTTSAFFAERLRPLRLPASFFTLPFFPFPAFSGLPLAFTFPAFPGLPLEFPAFPGLPLEFPNESLPFSFALATKQGVQNLA